MSLSNDTCVLLQARTSFHCVPNSRLDCSEAWFQLPQGNAHRSHPRRDKALISQPLPNPHSAVRSLSKRSHIHQCSHVWSLAICDYVVSPAPGASNLVFAGYINPRKTYGSSESISGLYHHHSHLTTHPLLLVITLHSCLTSSVAACTTPLLVSKSLSHTAYNISVDIYGTRPSSKRGAS